jgi:hypothetical protein
MSLTIELTWDNEILRVMSYGKEITHYSVEYIPCPSCKDLQCAEGFHDLCNTLPTRGDDE